MAGTTLTTGPGQKLRQMVNPWDKHHVHPSHLSFALPNSPKLRFASPVPKQQLINALEVLSMEYVE